MNDRVYSVLFKLCILYIVASFVLQFWFPEVFMIDVEESRFTRLLATDGYLWFYKNIVYNITFPLSIITFVCCGNFKKVKRKNILIIFICCVSINVFEQFVSVVNPWIMLLIMTIMCLMFAEMKIVSIILLVYFSFLQLATLSIRNLSTDILRANILFDHVVSIDCIVILCFLYKGRIDGFWERLNHFMLNKLTNKKNLLKSMSIKFICKLKALGLTASTKCQNTSSNLTNFISKSLQLFRLYKTSKENKQDTIAQSKYYVLYAEIVNEAKIKASDLLQIILAIGAIYVFGFILDKYVETIFFCISHYFVRPKFDKQYHCILTLSCIGLTTSVIFVGSFVTFPISISLLSNILVVLAVCQVGFLVRDRNDKVSENVTLQETNNELQALKDSLEKFDPTNCTETELLQKCKQKGLNKKDTDNAIVCFLKGFSGKELADHFGITENSAFRKKSELKSKLTS